MKRQVVFLLFSAMFLMPVTAITTQDQHFLHSDISSFSLDDSPIIEYIIITNEELEKSFQILADWKTRKGVPAKIRTTSSIYAVYPGRDNPEKIRNFIKDCYSISGTIWVLLGGDTDIVPCRQASTLENVVVPTDLYYSDLDRSWDENDNNIFGEVPEDKIDMYADVFVGRAPVNTIEETENFVNKVIRYGYVRFVPTKFVFHAQPSDPEFSLLMHQDGYLEFNASLDYRIK